jgi:hypothetical protein
MPANSQFKPQRLRGSRLIQASFGASELPGSPAGFNRNKNRSR